MLKIDFLAVGTRPPPWILQGMDTYIQRMQGQVKFSLCEVRTATRSGPGAKAAGAKEQCQAAEAAGLLAKHKAGARLIALDAGGSAWSTEQFATKLEDWRQRTSHLQFMIGGPDGLHRRCLEAADDVLSLSKLTFPHLLVRLLLVEQIYRTIMVGNNHPYHK